ncbi:toprim domain-containing protein [Mucilaginibacter psychrotolerans]|uniref:Zinc finger CHC2-type domain-containing protein n=1 Tax=Mucilaginibacter psychrotolerans TaxID=1524096 RepID=A0A4Y8SHP7_9SPHI|nr:toprim domain-containing protein [Mucilaginibacter psychrotolerans]TFF37936.1 hypothetical protein E2R66_10125 [Mucilaginibacter psychrotolerans]
MNIEQAKAISMTAILDALRIEPASENKKEAKYLSPFRNEKTASFHVSKHMNKWYDFGEGKGGDTVAFACLWLKCQGKDSNVSDALRWLGNMTFNPSAYTVKPVALDEKPKWVVTRVNKIEDLFLIRYLEHRGIPLSVAEKYLVEVYVKHSVKNTRIYALGMKNEDGGYELRNSFFKSCTAPKTITFIRGSVAKPERVHLFEGFMDYLSAIIRKEDVLQDDAIILNSISMIPHATGYIRNYGYKTAMTWMDNDNMGREATRVLAEFFQTEAELQHVPMNDLYMPHKDVNAWHMHQLNLSL